MTSNKFYAVLTVGILCLSNFVAAAPREVGSNKVMTDLDDQGRIKLALHSPEEMIRRGISEDDFKLAIGISKSGRFGISGSDPLSINIVTSIFSFKKLKQNLPPANFAAFQKYEDEYKDKGYGYSWLIIRPLPKQ